MRVSDLGVIASDVGGWPESLGAGPAITRVSDGDTIQLLDLEGVCHKIRLAKIDAPESKQEWGREAAEMLRGLVGDKMVRIVWDKLDRYRRIIGIVYVENVEINLAMVATGNAWHYKAFDSSHAYSEAEKSARENRLGLWAGSNVISPQEWRRRRKHYEFEAERVDE